MLSRRVFLQGLAGGSASMMLPGIVRGAQIPAGAADSALMLALPGKKPLIKRAFRPPNFESPLDTFDQIITPNDRFFVRWHLASIPRIAAGDWRLRVGGGAAEKPFELTLDQLRQEFEPAEIVAVCQCSGNRRGLSDPHVPGVEWSVGAMGNARWKGARLKDVLARAGLRADALEIAFNGGDSGAIDKTPDFIKSIPVWKALDENTLVAYEMNGEPLPHWNGFPARIVVPGWTATYWMKQVISIEALTKPESGFWMSAAYRVPKGKFPLIDRFVSQEGESNTPITEMVVNSLITSIHEGQRIPVGKETLVRGIAWDAGYGIRSVEVSVDGGNTWQEALLEQDMGRYSFRAWHLAFVPPRAGKYLVMARATNRQGSTQTFDLIFNPAGYHNNVMERIALEAV
ncbi:MAG: molybdopterin-dependent oxidoreductase [Proteobacteria bacterium]|nr:molybdopterin-dependent oxidoreductase [Pseudomonadota bacterium]HQR03050.1 molybdopterin-dependent oxidoreductase [Rhodocyclaceae bacterium]